MDKLKPCPFCGEPGQLNEYQDEAINSHALDTYFDVSCSGICPITQERSNDKADAIAAWNNRAGEKERQ